MLKGTFREWVDDGSAGIFTFDFDGVKQTIQVAIEDLEDGWSQPCYEVSVAPDRYDFASDAVADGLLTWDTIGDVTDG